MGNALTWDELGGRFYETGINHVAVYPYNIFEGWYNPGVAWNGVTAITESPSGAEPTDIYADNLKYLTIRSPEEYGATIEAYSKLDSIANVDGQAHLNNGVSFWQQTRGSFGLAYKTRIGNDAQLDDYGYKLHLLYGASTSPSEKAYNGINDSPEPTQFSWEVKAIPATLSNQSGESKKPTASVVIDVNRYIATTTPSSGEVPEGKSYSAYDNFYLLHNILYGTDDTDIINLVNDMFDFPGALGYSYHNGNLIFDDEDYLSAHTDGKNVAIDESEFGFVVLDKQIIMSSVGRVWTGSPWLPPPDDVFRILDLVS